ncbi:hypothetical protein OROHE_014311 [Orobanche hederae]
MPQDGTYLVVTGGALQSHSWSEIGAFEVNSGIPEKFVATSFQKIPDFSWEESESDSFIPETEFPVDGGEKERVSKAAYIEGVEESLIDLKKNGYEMHIWTNYPIWLV